VDILVNNAGVMLLSPIDALHQDEWDRMIDVNVKVRLSGRNLVWCMLLCVW
jgi:NADP-dependent 3-hydroxy acid dehydrogenase YdfG